MMPSQAAARFDAAEPPVAPTTLHHMPARIWVVMPTYNEAGNISGILSAAHAELGRAVPGDYRILVVDDSSPDGTGRLAEAMADEVGAIEVMHRPGKDGLGHAYLAGFARALAGGAELVIQMDSDFSHDPRYLRDLLRASEEADLVLGSRYVDGGGIRDWGLMRRVISRGGGLYARLILGVAVNDLTGGFKAIRREVLERIELETIQAAGYVFQIEVTYRALLAGFRVKEIPIVFSDRAHGTSKMSTGIALEAMWSVPRLRRNAAAAVARSTAAEALN